MEYAGHRTRDLESPADVPRKIFRNNALRWLHGLRASVEPRQSASIASATRLAERVAASMPQERLSANDPAKWTRPTASMMCGQNLLSPPSGNPIRSHPNAHGSFAQLCTIACSIGGFFPG